VRPRRNGFLGPGLDPGTPMATSGRGPSQTFHVATVLPAPLEFAYGWCTDFRPDDARREKDSYERRILSRTARRVVFENLTDDAHGGWWWARFVVDLRPPNRWHAESVGSHRTLSLDYELTARGPDRTRFDLRWRRWPTAIGPRRLSRKAEERATTLAWRNFAAALGADFRASRRGRRR